MGLTGLMRVLTAIAKNDPGPLVEIPVHAGKVDLGGILYEVFAVDASAGLTTSQQVAILNTAERLVVDGYNVILCYLIGNKQPRTLDYVVLLVGKKGNYVTHSLLTESVATGFMEKWDGEKLNKVLHELFGIQPASLLYLRGI